MITLASSPPVHRTHREIEGELIVTLTRILNSRDFPKSVWVHGQTMQISWGRVVITRTGSLYLYSGSDPLHIDAERDVASVSVYRDAKNGTRERQVVWMSRQ